MLDYLKRIVRKLRKGHGDLKLQALRAYDDGDHEIARTLMLQAASSGSVGANYWAGVYLQSGVGGPVDLSGAVGHYAVAAHKGHPKACYNLGVLYQVGQGCKANLDEAVKYYKAAADAGVPDAAKNLGAIYASSDTGLQHSRAAIENYKRAYSMGHQQSLQSAISVLRWPLEKLLDDARSDNRR